MLDKHKWLEECWRCLTPFSSVWKKFDMKYWSKGYGRPVVATVFVGFGWICAFPFAAIFTIYCITKSVALFCYGIFDTYNWWRAELSDNHDADRDDVETAEDMMYRLNNNTNNGSKHFRVDRLLKMTTGLDVEDIWRRIHLKGKIEDHMAGNDLAGKRECARFAACSM